MFKALAMIEQDDAIATVIAELEESDLPEGDVLIDVAYSSLNYKDGLVLNNLGGLVSSVRVRMEVENQYDPTEDFCEKLCSLSS